MSGFEEAVPADWRCRRGRPLDRTTKGGYRRRRPTKTRAYPVVSELHEDGMRGAFPSAALYSRHQEQKLPGPLAERVAVRSPKLAARPSRRTGPCPSDRTLSTSALHLQAPRNEKYGIVLRAAAAPLVGDEGLDIGGLLIAGGGEETLFPEGAEPFDKGLA